MAKQSPHRAVACKIPRREINRSDVRDLRKVSLKPPSQTKSDPAADYMEDLRRQYPASDSYEERKKRTDAMVEHIWGPERLNLAVGYASGHSGISDDPVITEYNRN